ncbi:MAG TPA: trypsin-like peptidase domain-containing protein, partial [Pilimelia sp.]|nr:trypsin-like peptidase domain-containing protein [Pilimelia sp.]
MPRPEHAIARVLGRTRPVGLAFLVRDRELLTCAHVVNTALGRPKEATDPALGAPLEIEFVFADGGRRRGAVVAGWLPTPGAFSQRDAAVLRLSETAPAELPRLRLADADAGGAGGD